jgi:hypothetical protein
MSTAPEPRALPLRAAASPAEVAILRTVAYASVFQSPASLAELHRTLMDLPLSRAALAARLRGAFLSQWLAVTDGLVHPRGRERWVALRRARMRRSRALVERHRFALGLLARLPFVRLLALSGACARDNAADEDVDVFLVVKRGRAWSVCLSLMLLCKALGVRRTLCANYIVDETLLALPENDLFTASEIVGLRPLAGRETYRRFVEANPWIAVRFPNFLRRYRWESRRVPEPGCPRWLEAWLESGPAPLLERLSRRWLGARLRRKAAGAPGVALSSQRLKLHTRDHRASVSESFGEALRELGLEPGEGSA